MQEEYKKFYNYLVYNDGRVYSLYRKKFLKPIVVGGYWQYKLYTNDTSKWYKAHRLVGYFWCNPPKNYKELMINHKDGNKQHNTPDNLEWCDCWYNNYHARATGLNNISRSNSLRWNDDKFRAKASKQISQSRIEMGVAKGENNPRFRYRIYDKYGNKYDRHSLSKFLDRSLSYTDTLINAMAHGKNKPKNLKAIEYGIYVIDIKKGQSTIESGNSKKNTVV